MKKIVIIILVTLFAVIFAGDSYADEVRTSSAKLASVSNQKNYSLDLRTKAVKNVFGKYKSPLLPEAANYVKYADEFGVDWRLLPSIAGLESSFGKFLMPESYNGYGWGGGYIYFESWEDGIRTINKALREKYMDRWGAKDVWTIGPIYAESPTWSVRVDSFMREIDREYQNLSKTLTI